jgi:hypothetical protein
MLDFKQLELLNPLLALERWMSHHRFLRGDSEVLKQPRLTAPSLIQRSYLEIIVELVVQRLNPGRGGRLLCSPVAGHRNQSLNIRKPYFLVLLYLVTAQKGIGKGEAERCKALI